MRSRRNCSRGTELAGSAMKHGTDKLKVGEPIPVNAEDCCTTCCPCPEEDFA